MQDQKKLNIRINFRPEQKNIVNDEIAYQYHWGRIIGVSLAVIIIIGSLLSVSDYSLVAGDVAEQQVKTPLTDTEEKTTESEVTRSVLAEELTVDETPVTNLMESVETAEKIEKNTATKIDLITEPTAPITEENTITTAVDNEIIPLDVSDNDNKNILQTPQEEVSSEPPASVENTDPAPLFTQSKTEILSEHVKRFIISPSVKSNEPFGRISDITFDHNNIATVYAFSEVSDLQSTTLYYHWSLNGKNVGKVRVGVGSSRWRSHSSKFIQPNMHGEWEVKLQNRKGEILAFTQFKY